MKQRYSLALSFVALFLLPAAALALPLFGERTDYEAVANHDAFKVSVFSKQVTLSATVLASTPNPSRIGQVVTLTATVTPDSATGPVTFRDGADSLGAATLSGGVATLTTSALGLGDHSLTAGYGGDDAYGASVSPVSPHTVLPGLTTIVLTSSPTPSVAGQQVLLTATVSPAGATGSVEFRNGATPLGTATLSDGVATLAVPDLCGGTYPLSAIYAGDADHLGSSSPAIEHVVSPAPTTLTVVSSPNPSRLAQAVSFTASVHGSAAPCALTGTVQFVVDGAPFGSPVALSGDSASATGITGLALGPHDVHAVYAGDASFQGSTSTTITQDVVLNSSATVLASTPNPSRIGQAVTLTATVTPSAATGTVEFRNGATLLGTATLSGGVATLTTSALGLGDHSLTAGYGGDDAYGASVSPVSPHTVLPGLTTIVLTSSPTPSVAGQQVLLTATVSPAGATGSVEFRNGATPLGTATLSDGVATLAVPDLCGGTYPLSAIYAGDADHLGSSSPAIEHVVSPAPTTLTVVSSPNPSRLAQAVSFTASVHGSAAPCALTGTVQFVVDGAPAGSPVALSGGSAALSGITGLASGSHTVRAVYAGNASFQGGTSPTITQEVESPRPVLVGVRDLVNDQGGHVKLLWNASYLDLAPYQTIESYWILRSAPSTAVARAALAGARVSRPGQAPDAQVGAFLAVDLQGTIYYWEYISSQPAFHVANYSYVAPTTCDSVAGSNPFTAFMVMARTVGGAQWWYSDPDSGYSVDNLAPGAPTKFTGTYSAGVATLHWDSNPEPDLGLYRLHRGATADFVPGPGNLVAARPDTGYVDAAGSLYHYKLCAVDVHGNPSGFTALLPTVTADVPGDAPLAFALEGVRPNPSRGDQLSVAFTLPTSAPARIELVDVSGRRVAEREVGTLGAGRHSVALAAGRQLAPGLYLVRLTQGADVRVTRAAVLR